MERTTNSTLSKIQKFIGKFCTPLYCNILLSLLCPYVIRTSSSFFIYTKKRCVPYATPKHTSNLKKKNFMNEIKGKHSIRYYDGDSLVLHKHIFTYTTDVWCRQHTQKKSFILDLHSSFIILYTARNT